MTANKMSIKGLKILLDGKILYTAEEVLPDNGIEEGETTQHEEEKRLPILSSAAGIEGPTFVTSKYGTRQLVLKQHTFNRHVNREDVTYWRCSQFAVLRCRARIKTKGEMLTVLNGQHNHEVILKARKYGSLKSSKRQAAADSAAGTSSGATANASGAEEKFSAKTDEEEDVDAE